MRMPGARMSVCVCWCMSVTGCYKGREKEGKWGQGARGEGWGSTDALLSKVCISSFRKSKPVAVGTVRDPDMPAVLLKGTGVDAEPTEHSVLRRGRAHSVDVIQNGSGLQLQGMRRVRTGDVFE